MITTDQFTFIHVHKTGGRSLNSVITQCMPNSKVVGYHYPHALIPDTQQHLPVVGVVRNPWDWYVSWYAFNRKMGLRNPLFIVVSDGGKADFKTTIQQLVKLGDDSAQSRAHRAALAAVLPSEFGTDRGAGLTSACIEGLREPNRGYYSWLFDRMLGAAESPHLHVARFENLQEDFIAITRRLGVAESAAMEAALQATEKKNSSSHSHYSCYFDSELRELIAERERGLIETYGYSFEDVANLDAPVPLPDFYSFDVGFRKLLGRAPNFLLLRSGVDITALRQKVEQLSAQDWEGSGREQKFRAHRHTASLILATDNFKHLPPTYSPLFDHFRHEVQPVLDTIANYYGNQGMFLRVLLVKLTEGEDIDPHFDEGMSLLHSHRVHVPIITNGQVMFCVGGEKRHLAAGEIWEINNATVHYVENHSNHARVHMIVDWAPKETLTHRERIAGVVKAPPMPQPSPPSRQPTVSRNDPCPCGSGQRYKNCHGKLT